MGRFVPLVFGALSALHVLGAIAQEIPTCIVSWVSSRMLQVTALTLKSSHNARTS